MPRNIDFLVPGGALSGPLIEDMLDAGPLPAELSPGTRLGPYAIERMIARGGAGAVYLAHRTVGFDQQVAIKVVRASSHWRERFAREQTTLGRLNHRAIVRILDAGSAEGVEWLAMEYVQGQPIDRAFARQATPWRHRVAVLAEIADALAYAHRELVVHGDLKPGNLLLDAHGAPRIVDFGIATDLRRDRAPGERAYTPGFASPEQLRGERLGAASDVWQCGRLLVNLCLEADAAEGGMRGRRGVAWARRELAAIADRAMQHETADRYPAVSALADDLRACLTGRPVAAVGLARGYRLRAFLRRHLVAAGALMALVVALAGGLAAALWQAGIARRHAEEAERTTGFVVSLLEAGNPETSAADDPNSMSELLATAARRLETELADQPLAQAELRATIGDALAARGRRDEGIALVEAAIVQLRGAGPAARKPLATALLRVAALYRLAGRMDDAAAAAGESIAVLGELGEASGLPALSARTTLASLAGIRGEYRRQTALYREILEQRRALLGDDDPRLAVDWNNLGAASLLRDDYAQAIDAYREALRLLRKDPQTPESRQAWIHAGLGVALRRLHRFEEARAELEAGLEIALRTLHPQHSIVATLTLGLGMLLADQGEPEAGLARVDEARRILGAQNHPDQVSAALHAGLVLSRLGRLAEAGAAFGEAVRGADMLRSQAEPQVLVARAGQALARLHAGDGEALHELRDAASRLDGLAEPARRWQMDMLDLLAEGERLAGEPQRARQARERRLVLLADLLGAGHPDVERARRNMPD